MPNVEYLEEERKKLWIKIEELSRSISEIQTQLNNDPEKDVRGISKKCSEYRNKILGTLQEVENLSPQLKDLSEKSQVILDASQNAIKINDLLQDAKSSFTNISNTIITLNEKHQEMILLQESANNVNTTAISFNKKIADLHSQAAKTKEELVDIYDEVAGYDYEDDATGQTLHEEGLKEKLEKSYKKLENDISILTESINSLEDTTAAWVKKFQIDNETSFNTLKDKIKSLLPEALTAGLSGAYQKKRETEEENIESAQKSFQKSVWGLIAISLIPFLTSIYLMIDNKSLETVILEIPRMVLAIVPLYAPVLWLAYSANKRMNLAKRLIEEYTHKEVLSKTFEGLSNQIANLDDSDDSKKLKLKLLYNMVYVSSENPGKLITDYQKSDHPMTDVLDKSILLGQSLEKLGNIPGISIIAQKIIRQNEQKQDQFKKQMANAIEETAEDEK